MPAQNGSSTFKFNLLQKGTRKRLHELDLDYSKTTYKDMDDHKQMNIHVYAEFQKEQFKKRKKEKLYRRWMFVSVICIVFLILVGLLWMWNDYDFSIWNAPLFE